MAELLGTTLFNDANLVEYYTLEDVNADKGSRNLTNTNTVTFTAGKYSNAANGSATNTNKNLGNTADNYGIDGGAITLVGWINVSAAPGTNAVFSFASQQSATSHVDYVLNYADVSGTKQLQFQRSKQGVAAQQATYDVTLTNGVWHHVALTYDATNIRGYYDGSLVAGPTAASGSGSSNNNKGFMLLADVGGGAGGVNFASGLVDDFAIFSDALTAGEVTTLYSDTTAGARRLALLGVG